MSKDTKQEQEKALRRIISDTGTEVTVLARYMQIMSEAFCRDFSGKAINIHHSFLPGFKGARPYHQAYERGVKMIGATAHFVTADLDEGPIITQDTIAIDHSFTPEKLQMNGMDIESRVLSKALLDCAERRVFLHEGRTIIL